MKASQFKKYLRENGLGFGANAKGTTVSPDGIGFKKSEDPEQVVVRVRRSYFYHPKSSLTEWADKVVVAFDGIGADASIISTDDVWRSWPKESYYEVVVRVNRLPEALPA